MLREVIEVVGPGPRRVASSSTFQMCGTSRLEVGVDALRDVDEPVLVATGQVEELQLGRRRRIRHQFGGGFAFGAEENAPIHAKVLGARARS